MSDSNKIKWLKPSGLNIETNDKKETVAYCESLKWERADEPTKKRGRPAKPKEAE